MQCFKHQDLTTHLNESQDTNNITIIKKGL